MQGMTGRNAVLNVLQHTDSLTAMRLRTSESYWFLKNGILNSYPSLQESISTEIVVAGGGITGALISDALVDAGFDVVLIDKRDIGQGSTSASTSMLQYEIDKPLIELVKLKGEIPAVHCYRAGIEAILELETLLEGYQLDCGFKRKKSLYLAHNLSSARWLDEECAFRDNHALGVAWLDARTIEQEYGLCSYGGILSDVGASLDAYRCAHSLIALNHGKGMRVFDQSPPAGLDFCNHKVIITFPGGHELKAKHAIFCNGFETLRMFRTRYANIISTFACVSEQGIAVAPKLHDTLVWNTDNPYLYLRMTDDMRLLAGGEDVPYSSGVYRERMKKKKSEKLQKKLHRLMGDGASFIEDFSWGGAFGVTADGLPYIGTHPDFPGCLFVMGFGGNGITFSVQGRQICLDILQGRTNELSHYYRFDR